ncbi:MAG: tetratricopeptide repeat protein [Actinobacteria bacterium]|nr:tetratricopeptide repeat protein [Actinomycetota bacterium]
MPIKSKESRSSFSVKALNYLVFGLIAGILILLGMILYTVFFEKPVPKSPEEQEYYLALDLVKKNPNNSYYLQRLAEAQYDMGRYKESIKTYRKAIKIAPYRPMLHYGMGMCYLKLGDKKNAFKEFQEELKVTNNMNELAWYEIGKLYKDEKNYEDAEKAFQWALKRAPTLTDVHFELAKMYYDWGKYDSSRKEVLETLRYDPTNDAAKDFLVKVEEKLKKLKKEETTSSSR